MTILEKIWYYEPRSCLKCGSFSATDSQFCRSCFAEFYKSGDCLYRREDPLSIFYLFNWIPGESDSLSFLFRHLKGAQKQAAWAFYAKIFWQEIYWHCMEDFQGKDVLLIPSPSKNQVPDHAETFCQYLSEISGFPFAKALERVDSNEQKTLRKKDRRQDRFRLRENFSADLLLGKDLIFVDDILTTGGTALAAQRALSVPELGISPKNFTVWALASRAFGCG